MQVTVLDPHEQFPHGRAVGVGDDSRQGAEPSRKADAGAGATSWKSSIVTGPPMTVTLGTC